MDYRSELVSLLPWIRWQAGRYYRSVEDAEDLASDTVLHVLQALHRFDGKDLRSLCFVTMQRLYINRYNRKDVVVCRDTLTSPHADSSSADERVRMHDALRTLRRSRKLSMCVDCVLDYARGYSYAEIAERHGISVGTVCQRIWRGRKLLAKVL